MRDVFLLPPPPETFSAYAQDSLCYQIGRFAKPNKRKKAALDIYKTYKTIKTTVKG